VVALFVRGTRDLRFAGCAGCFDFVRTRQLFGFWGRHRGLPLRVSIGSSIVGATPCGCPVWPKGHWGRSPSPATKSSDGGDPVPTVHGTIPESSRRPLLPARS